MRLGYACINLELKDLGIYSTRTCILKTAHERGIDYLRELALANIHDLKQILIHNEKCGYRFFRLTSNLFPHLGNPQLKGIRGYADYNMKFASELLKSCGRYALDHGHRITMHPGQYAQLGSPREEVVLQTIIDLTNHADLFVMMGLKPQYGSVMIIHGGGVFGDKLETLRRWKKNFLRLPEYVREFISLENDEWSYSVKDLLGLSVDLNIPLCVDFFHHRIGHADNFDIFEPGLFQQILNTWKLRGIKPKCHLSDQNPDARKGTHSDCIDEIPYTVLKLCAENNIDIMLEVKQKDRCLLSVLERHFTKNVISGRTEWILKGM